MESLFKLISLVICLTCIQCPHGVTCNKIEPGPGQDNMIRQFHMQRIIIELKSNCSNIPVTFSVNSTIDKTRVESKQTECNETGTFESNLSLNVTVKDEFNFTIITYKGGSPNGIAANYQVKLRALCESSPCPVEGQICEGGTKNFTCSCWDKVKNISVCQDPVPGGSTSKLGTGAIIGIAVGCGIAVIVIIIVIVAVIVARKRKSKEAPRVQIDTDKESGKGDKETDTMLEKKGSKENVAEIKTELRDPETVNADEQKENVKFERNN